MFSRPLSRLCVDFHCPSGHEKTHALLGVVCSEELSWQKLHSPGIRTMTRLERRPLALGKVVCRESVEVRCASRIEEERKSLQAFSMKGVRQKFWWPL